MKWVLIILFGSLIYAGGVAWVTYDYVTSNGFDQLPDKIKKPLDDFKAILAETTENVEKVKGISHEVTIRINADLKLIREIQARNTQYIEDCLDMKNVLTGKCKLAR